MRNLWIIVSLSFCCLSWGQNFQVAVLKYNGGGDYYANPTSVPNLVKFANDFLKANIDLEVPYVDVGSPALFSYPFVHMTGHGNVVFSNSERENLRTYLLGGGFLHIDDNYGMDEFIRPEIQKLFPNEKLVELPFSHPIFHQKYNFNNGLPKIHEHDNQRPQAFGIIIEGRLVLLYTHETDLGDGWEDQGVHNDPPEKREAALKMGANILQFILIKGGIE
ncbi:MAG: DUF4159 domain-containing protein [Brumimicrobium sp.]|nr:DUF4159 domain-containing protein [Brumimicrobium sp.]MCO5269377.1 DUF4159 domain-containing protein [Brumimicrobium sp.]